MLKELRTTNLGPASSLNFPFGERVNLITGDNGLGKTFVLDLAWWALTRTWADGKVIRPANDQKNASISFTLVGKGGSPLSLQIDYNTESQDWNPFPQGAPPAPGLVIYPRIDGGFSVKDPERNRWRDKDDEGRPIQRPEAFQFAKREVWEGLDDIKGTKICRGLVEDWETWRLKDNDEFKMMSGVLEQLSPGGKEQPLRPGNPTRLFDDYGAQDIPTLVMPYGEVPIYHASAAVRRILSLAYLIVWSWSEHRIEAKARGHEPAKRIILLWDEIEAHLHPQWQRTILPSVVSVLQRLLNDADGTELQIIATTHAPLVLASMETKWEDSQDKLFNLELDESGSKVKLEHVTWSKFGDASGWLTSPAFDMCSGYSREAERAIQAADDLMADYVDELPEGLQSAEAINKELERTLDGSDPYWPMWLPFYRRNTKQSNAQ